MDVKLDVKGTKKDEMLSFEWFCLYLSHHMYPYS